MILLDSGAQQVVAVVESKLTYGETCFWWVISAALVVYIARVVWAIIREALGYDKPFRDTTNL